MNMITRVVRLSMCISFDSRLAVSTSFLNGLHKSSSFSNNKFFSVSFNGALWSYSWHGVDSSRIMVTR